MERPQQLHRILALLVVVLGSTAAALWALDRVALAAGGPTERSFATVVELERAALRHLALPAYFPASLRWPPTSVRLISRPHVTAVLAFAGTGTDARERLYVAQTLDGAEEIPMAMLPAGVVLERRYVKVGQAPATYDRIKGPDGATWYALTLWWNDRAVLLLSRGGQQELFKMAGSLRVGS